MNTIIIQLQYFFVLMWANVPLALELVGGLWAIFFINKIFFRGYLNLLGIYPRSLRGLPGIVFSPFLHVNFNHLFFNSIPLFALIDFLLVDGIHDFIIVTIVIILLSGFATWLMGRKAIHVGASSLIMGYWAYLLLNAYQRPSAATIMLAIICVYYFGGLLLNLFPREERVSWEGHLFGFLAGLVAVYVPLS